jgi:SAM-dependent methyltransferase
LSALPRRSLPTTNTTSIPAAEYDAWYRTPRGAWIGEAEFRLLAAVLEPRAGETLLDIGCGTGYFTRRFARERGLAVTGLDPSQPWLEFARANAAAGEAYVPGIAESLPFPDRSFDLTVSVAALCFVREERRAVVELLRVTRRRFAIGLLNRDSLLYGEKAERGAYRGARWHTPAEARALFCGLGVRALRLRSAVFLPGGGPLARHAEPLLPARWLRGALLVAAGEAPDAPERARQARV